MDETTPGGNPPRKVPFAIRGDREAQPDAGRAKIAVAVGGLLALSAVGGSAAFVADEMAPVAEPPVASVALPPSGPDVTPQTPARPGSTATVTSPMSPASATGSFSRSAEEAVPVQNVAPALSPPSGLRLGSIAVPAPVRVLAAPSSLVVAPPQSTSASAAAPGPAAPVTVLSVTPASFAAGLVEASKSPVPDRAEVPMAVAAASHAPRPSAAPASSSPAGSATPSEAASRVATWAGAVTAAHAAAAKTSDVDVDARPAGPASPPAAINGGHGPGADADRPAEVRPDVAATEPAEAHHASVWGAAVGRPGAAVAPANGRDHGDGPSH